MSNNLKMYQTTATGWDDPEDELDISDQSGGSSIWDR